VYGNLTNRMTQTKSLSFCASFDAVIIAGEMSLPHICNFVTVHGFRVHLSWRGQSKKIPPGNDPGRQFIVLVFANL